MTVQKAIDGFRAAFSAWKATLGRGEEECDNEEFEALVDAEIAFLQCRCQSLAEIREKAAFILSNDNMLQSFTGDLTREGEDYSLIFLRSLIIDQQAP